MKRLFILAMAIPVLVGMAWVFAQPGGGPMGMGPGNGPGGPQGPGQGPGGPGGGHPRVPPPVMTALDIDQDGQLSAEEISQAADSLLTLDANEDGIIDRTEMRPPRPPVDGDMVDRIMQRDMDEDGLLSPYELLHRPIQDLFDNADVNLDGYLDVDELDVWFADHAPDPQEAPAPPETGGQQQGQSGPPAGGPPNGGGQGFGPRR